MKKIKNEKRNKGYIWDNFGTFYFNFGQKHFSTKVSIQYF